MGKPDKTQPKLNFEQAEKTPDQTADNQQQPAQPTTSEQDITSKDIHTMFTTIQSTLAALDGKMDNLTYRVDRMSERLDRHTERIDMAERRISDMEDTNTQVETKQAAMDKQLAALSAKAEDLDARSRRCNVRLMGIAETPNTGPMEKYIEQLLPPNHQQGRGRDR